MHHREGKTTRAQAGETARVRANDVAHPRAGRAARARAASVATPAGDRERLRIGVIVPPMLPVPPPMYSGTERVVATLVDELVRRGHDVTLFASGDSETGATLVPILERSLWSTGYRGDVSAHINVGLARLWDQADEFEVIHSHAETLGFLMARHCPTPMLTTLHGRLDVSGIPELLEEFSDIPLVSISESQRRWAPKANWVATIHHGLPLEGMPFGQGGEDLAFVGRITPEKGVAEAIELARRVGVKLRVAAKIYDEHEHDYFEEVVRPAIDEGIVEFLGELPPLERDPVFAASRATVMLGGWPEPFGLVAIESMATGSPVIARRAGALTETVEHGVDGFLVDDLDEAVLAFERVAKLDRTEIRRRAVERFSPVRMADEYETVYRELLTSRQRQH
ncbi:MAG TPA: glycosyltransferase family 4 protein [Candidatus Limnocylindrales bacterium]